MARKSTTNVKERDISSISSKASKKKPKSVEMSKSPATAAVSAVEEPSQEKPVPSVSKEMESRENETPKETEEDIEA
jgi:hypothetical protein